MKFALGNFARYGIESRLGKDLTVGVQAALAHYMRRLNSTGRPPAAPLRPPIADCEEETCAGQAESTVLDLPVAPATLAKLRREALSHEVPLEEILSHAVLVYLADLDAQAAAWQRLGEPSLV